MKRAKTSLLACVRFSHQRKPRSNYRRPSNLGLSNNPLHNKSESRSSFEAKPSGRGHIVAKSRDNLKMEGDLLAKETEVRAQFRNLDPKRPQIYKSRDSLRPEGSLVAVTETLAMYEDKRSRRPIIHKIYDHAEQVQPKGQMVNR